MMQLFSALVPLVLTLAAVLFAVFAFFLIQGVFARLKHLPWIRAIKANRRRHPDLIRREDEGEDPFLIAQEMMMRDRAALRARSERGEVRYPDIWNYYMPTTEFGFKIAQTRRAAREADLSAIRERLRAMRRLEAGS